MNARERLLTIALALAAVLAIGAYAARAQQPGAGAVGPVMVNIILPMVRR